MGCKHSWRLGHSRQFTWEEKVYGNKKTVFGNAKVSYKIFMYGRIDQFYCCKCLEPTIKKRESDKYKSEWWIDGMESKHSVYGRPTEMFDNYD